MKYYSTNNKSLTVSLSEAVIKGLAPDRGLYMPERINSLSKDFFDNIDKLTFKEIAFEVASKFFGEDVEKEDLKNIVYETLEFDCPIVKVEDNIFALELFHGPTLAFKDVGARFMARLLGHFIKGDEKDTVNVLVATSGDTGSAVANGFLGVKGIHVWVLYPKGKVSQIQESQFTTLGKNITALEVDGVFDDCQALVKTAFLDEDLNKHMRLTSANSINVARFLPQAFYYFNAYARLKEKGLSHDVVICVPSGNFGNLTSGLVGKKMGLPVKRFISANNANRVVYDYLKTGQYVPKESIQTIANAMDVGDPSNFARILDLYGADYKKITSELSGATFQDDEILKAIKDCNSLNGYILDPHGACGYLALKEMLREGETGVFLETAHPAKFKPTVESAIGKEVDVPERLKAFMRGKKQSIEINKDFQSFKEILMNS